MISDDTQHYNKWTVWRYEKEGWEEGRVENAEFAVKDLDWYVLRNVHEIYGTFSHSL